MHLLAEFGTGEVLWSMLWFFLIFIWIWIFITVVADIFRSSDLGGGAKALWLLFCIFLPYLGVFVYLIARGGSMQQRQLDTMKAHEEATRQYIQSVAAPAAGASSAEELARLADLKEKGVIDDAEFAALKAKAISG
jgi:hypothetical protein